MGNAPAGLPQRFCANHPQRAAIGVCVITQMPICSECSTRYEGVNYSKEGLRILRERRAAGTKTGAGVGGVLAWLFAPVGIWLMYLSYAQGADLLVNLLHWDR